MDHLAQKQQSRDHRRLGHFGPHLLIAIDDLSNRIIGKFTGLCGMYNAMDRSDGWISRSMDANTVRRKYIISYFHQHNLVLLHITFHNNINNHGDHYLAIAQTYYFHETLPFAQTGRCDRGLEKF